MTTGGGAGRCRSAMAIGRQDHRAGRPRRVRPATIGASRARRARETGSDGPPEPRPELQPPARPHASGRRTAMPPAAAAPQPAASALSPREHRWLTIVLVLGAIALFFVVLDQLASVWALFSDLILTFFFAWLLGFILEPIAAWLARFMPRVLAVTIAYGSVALVAFGLVVVAASALFASITDFLKNLDQFQQDLVALIQPISDWLRSLGFDQVNLSTQVGLDPGHPRRPGPDPARAAAGRGRRERRVRRQPPDRLLPGDLHLDRPRGHRLVPAAPGPAGLRQRGAPAHGERRAARSAASFAAWSSSAAPTPSSRSLCNLVLGPPVRGPHDDGLRHPDGDPVLRALRRLGAAGDRGGRDQARRPPARDRDHGRRAGSSTRTSSSRASWPTPSASTRSSSSPRC